MRKIVVLEGCDGGGKTTLAGWLRDMHGYTIVKTGPPEPGGDLTRTYIDALHDAMVRTGRTVFDRLHLGEAIYGPLLRGVDRIGIEGLAMIERDIALRNVRLIICAPPWDALVAGWASKEDVLKNVIQLKYVYDAYLAHAARLGVAPYDWTAPNAQEVLKGLIEV